MVSEPESTNIKEKPEKPQWDHNVAELSCSDQQGLLEVVGKMDSFPGELECSNSNQVIQWRNTDVLDGNVPSPNLETPASEPSELSGDFCCSSSLGPALFPPLTPQHLFPQLDAGVARTENCLETPKILLSGD